MLSRKCLCFSCLSFDQEIFILICFSLFDCSPCQLRSIGAIYCCGFSHLSASVEIFCEFVPCLKDRQTFPKALFLPFPNKKAGMPRWKKPNYFFMLFFCLLAYFFAFTLCAAVWLMLSIFHGLLQVLNLNLFTLKMPYQVTIFFKFEA